MPKDLDARGILDRKDCDLRAEVGPSTTGYQHDTTDKFERNLHLVILSWDRQGELCARPSQNIPAKWGMVLDL